LKKRDPIARFENYLVNAKQVRHEPRTKAIAKRRRQLEADRDFAVASPMPELKALSGVRTASECHEIRPKDAALKSAEVQVLCEKTEASVHLK
jgi:TPP-dependent pyruvate/acetoin dehydrogenase alpha subunit